MKIARRIHMFSGIALFPWVVLYGITGFLFNHPDDFSDRDVSPIRTEEFALTPLAAFADPARLAGKVVDSLNRRDGTEGETGRIRLSDARRPSFSRDLGVSAGGPGQDHNIFVDLESLVGICRTAAVPPPAPGPSWQAGAGGGTEVAGLGPAVEQSVRAILRARGLEADRVVVRNAPELVFAVDRGDGSWRVACDLRDGALSFEPVAARDASLSTRRFLTGLHLACRYPPRAEFRWAWALLVDAMAAFMVFWGLSGLLMWWQIKSMRAAGAVAIVASLAAAALIGIGMHGALVR